MDRAARSRGIGLAALLVLLAAGCTSPPTGGQPLRASSPGSAHAQRLAGGCSGTVVSDAEPPAWAQAGFRHAVGTPWPVPWALGRPGDAVAFLFATQLVAGGPRPDGSNNKIAWVARGNPSTFLVEGRPLGRSQPVVTVPGGPSIVDVPVAGCWTFRVSWGSGGEQSSTIDLDVLPAGMLPSRPPGT